MRFGRFRFPVDSTLRRYTYLRYKYRMTGIVCSMFTAITVTRAIVQIIYGKRRNLKKLSI